MGEMLWSGLKARRYICQDYIFFLHADGQNSFCNGPKVSVTFLGPKKGTLATVNSVQRWWKKGPGQFEAMKTKNARGKSFVFLSLSEGNINLSEYFTSHVGSHKCGLCDHVSQNKRLIRHAQPSRNFYSEDLSFLYFPSLFRARIRIQSGLWIRIRIRIEEGKNDPQKKKKKIKIFHVLKCWMFSFESWRLLL